MLVQPAQIELHLSLVAGFEITDFQFNGHQPSQASMVEKKVEVIIVAIHRDPFLAFEEGKAHGRALCARRAWTESSSPSSGWTSSPAGTSRRRIRVSVDRQDRSGS